MTLETAVNSRSRRLACVTVLVLMAGGLAALVWAAFTPSKVRVVYNASDSVPIGWYRITPLDTEANTIPVDSIVLVDLPDEVAALADQRGYLPLDVPLLKRVGAAAPQHVCIESGRVRIDGAPVAQVLLIDALARPLPSWTHCRQLAEGELFLLSTTNPDSFDSRYFGPIEKANVIGVAHRLDLE
ncbi:S26 family signal peptidase [Spongiibacter tropicus]|uniref:S26 family signal peptidase n=1 Tax=Spongiibacter tropicus TaxID=454602 RepID=UPI0003B703E3|nr:S26 family signal peptidase [Spongiibacter tropicus]